MFLQRKKVGEKPEDKPVYFYDENFKITVYYVDEHTVQKRKDLKPEEWEGSRFMLKHNLSTKPEVYIDADRKTMYSLFNPYLSERFISTDL